MGDHSLAIPDSQTPEGGVSITPLDHNVVVTEAEPQTEQEKTQLQRDDEYHTLSMGESQRMREAEEMDQLTTYNRGSAGILSSGGGDATSRGKLQVSANFEAEIHAREEAERKAKEEAERRKQEEEFRKLTTTDSHNF